MRWVAEGFVGDEAGNLIATSDVELCSPGDWPSTQLLIKGCRRDHALADGETGRVSPASRCRTDGTNLTHDKPAGLANVETAIVDAETPAEIFERHRLADVDAAA